MTWGPWSAGCKGHDERKAQLRSLAGIAHMMGLFELSALLRRAEADPMEFAEAELAVERLPALRRRHLMSVFSAITFGTRRT